MSKQNLNLLELDVEKLFEDYKIEDIIEIEKLLDTEIEKKRIELRSMVGYVVDIIVISLVFYVWAFSAIVTKMF